jgi:hypothetical protein
LLFGREIDAFAYALGNNDLVSCGVLGFYSYSSCLRALVCMSVAVDEQHLAESTKSSCESFTFGRAGGERINLVRERELGLSNGVGHCGVGVGEGEYKIV